MEVVKVSGEVGKGASEGLCWRWVSHEETTTFCSFCLNNCMHSHQEKGSYFSRCMNQINLNFCGTLQFWRSEHRVPWVEVLISLHHLSCRLFYLFTYYFGTLKIIKNQEDLNIQDRELSRRKRKRGPRANRCGQEPNLCIEIYNKFSSAVSWFNTHQKPGGADSKPIHVPILRCATEIGT